MSIMRQWTRTTVENLTLSDKKERMIIEKELAIGFSYRSTVSNFES